jgi:hypothetical protein
MPGPFPTALLVHSVRVYRRSTAITNGEPVETGTLLGTAACAITEVSSARGQNDQAEANVRFEVVKGPVAAGTVFFPQGGRSPHGLGNLFRDFSRFRVSTIALG